MFQWVLLFLVLLYLLLRVFNRGVFNRGVYMEVIKDYNNDNKIDWKDYIIYSVMLTGNIIFTIINIVH